MRERLQALAAFLPLFEKPGFVYGTWHKSEQEKPGVFVLPHFEPSETAVSFVHTAYDQGWVLVDWAWSAWIKTEEAVSMRDDPAALAVASPKQLAKLLTVLIRQDRYVEGALNSAFESGLLTAIIRREAELVEQDDKWN